MSTLTVLMVFCSLSFLLVLALLAMLYLVQTRSQDVTLTLLIDQRVENQSLRNQLRSPDVGTLLGLNHSTLPSNATASNSEGSEPINLGEAIDYEEQLAKQGYSVGDLGNDLEAAGWNPPVVRRNTDGEPTAYES